MGLSTDIRNTAQQLRRDLEDGIDIRQALIAFSESLERAAVDTQKRAMALLASHGGIINKP